MKQMRGMISSYARETGFPYMLTEGENGIRIRVNLRGIDEKMIRIDLEGKTLTIFAGNGEGQRIAISLPCEARLGRKRFREGVLDLCLEKPA